MILGVSTQIVLLSSPYAPIDRSTWGGNAVHFIWRWFPPAPIVAPRGLRRRHKPKTFGFVFLPCHHKVLNGERSSYASDVYSFGVVVWEVITTELPWASAECARDVMCAVINGTRPLFPADTPAGIAAIAKECWAEAPYDRPSFKRVMAGLRLRSKGLSEQGRELENKCCGDSSSGIDTLGQRTEERPASPGVGNFLSRASYQ